MSTLKLDEDDLTTIAAVAENGQCGRITKFEIAELVRVYREAASRLQAPAVAEVEDALGTLPAVTIRSMETMPKGDAHLVSQAWVHEGCVIEIRGTNDKAIGWIDTHEWLFDSVYRHHLLPALRTGGSE